MAANKSVTVLAPNGHRQNVKATPNTTILQILEEVCQKQGYNPDEYDLKYYTRILDTNASISSANLASKVSLEMVPCKKPRKFSNITICITPETGERLTGEFPPTTTLAEILEKLCGNYDKQNSVIIYMQRNIHGIDQFESITLKSLGLNSGRALLRLMNRDPEQLKSQAHVYVPPSIKVSKTEIDDDDRRRPQESNIQFVKQPDPIALFQQERASLQCEKTTKDVENNSVCETNDTTEIMEVDGEVENEPENFDDVEESKVEYLGERNALLFNQASAKALPMAEIPDSFFELTTTDATILLKDIRKKLAELEDSPLVTSAQREMERDNKTLSTLHKYKKVILRIQFPNQLVLQGLFGPLETVQMVKDFVKTYLEDPAAEFCLYTTPPRKDLNVAARLIDEQLVPCAIIYFAGKSDLKSDVKMKLTDPRAASNEAMKTRLAVTRPNEDSTGSQTRLPATSESRPGTSSSQKSQVPKWFKPSK